MRRPARERWCAGSPTPTCEADLRFQHLIQVNDPLVPLIDPLTRDQVWRGLQLKAENPLLFVYALDGFEVLAKDGDSIARELRFGQAVIRDRVIFMPPDRIRQEIEAGGEVPGATLLTTIETPDNEQLFVRFEYETRPQAGAPPDDESLQGFVKQAYVEADRDTIRTIRRLVADGTL
jgi:hypothetical protein